MREKGCRARQASGAQGWPGGMLVAGAFLVEGAMTQRSTKLLSSSNR
jgi:hypothetical protein